MVEIPSSSIKSVPNWIYDFFGDISGRFGCWIVNMLFGGYYDT